MRQRITLMGALLVLLVVVFLMARDMFRQKPQNTNPYEYSIDPFKHIDTNDFCYELNSELKTSTDKLEAIAIDQQDNILVADSTKIRIYNPTLKPMETFETAHAISSLHAGAGDQIYIGMNDHVEVWNRSGKMLAKWDPYSEKSILTSITSLENKICIADAGTKKLLLYDQKGNLIRTLGEKDPEERKFGFMIPSPYFDVDVSREGYFWVTNPGLHMLEAFDSTGRAISSWAKSSMQLDGFSGCCNPTHFALLSDDRFVTVEKGLVRIKIHQPDGSFECAVDGPLSFDEKESEMDIGVNSEDEIFVLVPSEKKIRKYIRKPEN